MSKGDDMFKQGFPAAVVLLAVIVWAVALAQPAVQEEEAQSLLSAFMSYTDLRLTSVQQGLELLAATSEVRSGQWENMRGLLALLQKLDGKLAVWYVLPDGTYYTVDQGRMDVKLSEREYFADLMAGRKIIGSLVVSKSTGRRSAVTAIPIEQGGRVVAAVGASLFLDRVAEEIGSLLHLRPEVSFFALAPDGRTTLHQKTERHFLDPRELGSETLKDAVNEMLAQDAGEATYFFDNVQKKAMYRTSPLTQWKFALTFPGAKPR
jgi:hypothetical protein